MRIAALAVVAVLSVPAPAVALEPTGSLIGDAFLRTLEAGGYRNARAEGAERAGDGLELTAVAAEAEDGRALSIAHVTLRRPAINADDALTAEAIEYQDVRLREETGETTIAGLAMTEAVLATVRTGEDARLSGLVGPFRSLSVNDVVTTAAASPGVEVTLGAATLALAEADGTQRMRFVMEGLSFPTRLLDGQAGAQMARLGYDTLRFDFVGEGGWSDATGGLTVDTLTLRGTDLGTLSLSLSASGLTAETVAALTGDLTDLADLLTTLDAAKVEGLTLAYEDAGLAERILSRAAEEAGMPRARYAEAVLMGVSRMVEPMDDDVFAHDVKEAARVFLSGPGQIEVSAEPEATLSLAQLAGLAAMRPFVLPRLLNLSVRATPAP